ncbi:MAG: adenylate/guanylate cyclase domain-containing protein [Leptolyngbyaceae bacterium]|nr:adenylate/guanylate cyclase domain-containing protein [Leptolyngbyaceae bacterium]
MSASLNKLPKLLTARLSRHIVLWMFASIVMIEGIILVPSVYRREKELLLHLRQVSAATMLAIAQTAPPQVSAQEFLMYLQQAQRLNPAILGASLYRLNGQWVGNFGMMPDLSFTQGKRGESSLFQAPNHSRYYDVALSVSHRENPYLLVIRHDGTSVTRELKAFRLRIAGLVVLISAFVTIAMMIALGAIVIAPILQLRWDLIRAGEAVSKDQICPAFESATSPRQDELGDVIVAFRKTFQQIYQTIADRKQAEAALRIEKDKSERLLLNILPPAIAEQLKQESGAIADRFEAATILFADLVDFTGLAAPLTPTQLVEVLNEIFSTFDQLAEQYGLEKIKTIGDAYMVVGGLPVPRSDHAEAIAAMALDMQQAIQRFHRGDNQPFKLRIGINTGPVVAGVIGLKKFTYDLWGDAVNVASRMESHGLVGQIQVTETTYNLLKEKYVLEPRGEILVKGKGEMMTYLLVGRQTRNL